jgi:Zn-finger nucleic acid-binding protein
MIMASFTCPVDGAVLVPIERSGIEIDHCPSCRGVWLDRGELDKIVERSATSSPAPAPPPEQYRGDERPRYDDRGHGHGHPHKRRKSFLEELFD